MHTKISQREIEQLRRCFVARECPSAFDDLTQAPVEALDRVGGVNHFSYLGREGEERLLRDVSGF